MGYDKIPEMGLPYPALNEFVFGSLPDSWLTGHVAGAYTGHATDEAIRRNGASGGVITQALLHLLETGQITGAVVLRMRQDKPYLAEPFIARTAEEIKQSSQSVYVETPVLNILEKIDPADGPLAFVGLPDHIATIRHLQMKNDAKAKAIKYCLGPYTGTILQLEAIKSYLRSNKAILDDIVGLKYRAGEWPGYLQIKLRDGRTLKAEKFYYNYLIPFFITNRTSLLACDFTNELTDFSVGDAWAPEFEEQGGGWSVVLARTETGQKLLREMEDKNIVRLSKIDHEKVIEMHGHMIDFKKRGSFIRIDWRKKKGLPAPDFGYKPVNLPASRINTERIISFFFWIGRQAWSRWIIEHLPLKIIGPVFNWMRLTWKKLSKKEKRAGLSQTEFVTTSPDS